MPSLFCVQRREEKSKSSKTHTQEESEKRKRREKGHVRIWSLKVIGFSSLAPFQEIRNESSFFKTMIPEIQSIFPSIGGHEPKISGGVRRRVKIFLWEETVLFRISKASRVEACLTSVQSSVVEIEQGSVSLASWRELKTSTPSGTPHTQEESEKRKRREKGHVRIWSLKVIGFSSFLLSSLSSGVCVLLLLPSSSLRWSQKREGIRSFQFVPSTFLSDLICQAVGYPHRSLIYPSVYPSQPRSNDTGPYTAVWVDTEIRTVYRQNVAVLSHIYPFHGPVYGTVL